MIYARTPLLIALLVLLFPSTACVAMSLPAVGKTKSYTRYLPSNKSNVEGTFYTWGYGRLIFTITTKNGSGNERVSQCTIGHHNNTQSMIRTPLPKGASYGTTGLYVDGNTLKQIPDNWEKLKAKTALVLDTKNEIMYPRATRKCWFIINKGLLAFGQGDPRTSKPVFVWRIAPEEGFKVTDLKIKRDDNKQLFFWSFKLTNPSYDRSSAFQTQLDNDISSFRDTSVSSLGDVKAYMRAAAHPRMPDIESKPATVEASAVKAEEASAATAAEPVATTAAKAPLNLSALLKTHGSLSLTDHLPKEKSAVQGTITTNKSAKLVLEIKTKNGEGNERTSSCILGHSSNMWSGIKTKRPEGASYGDNGLYTFSSGSWMTMSASSSASDPDNLFFYGPQALMNSSGTSSWWFTLTKGLIALGKGDPQTEATVLAWRIAPAEGFTITDIRLTNTEHRSGFSVNKIELSTPTTDRSEAFIEKMKSYVSSSSGKWQESLTKAMNLSLPKAEAKAASTGATAAPEAPRTIILSRSGNAEHTEPLPKAFAESQKLLVTFNAKTANHMYLRLKAGSSNAFASTIGDWTDVAGKRAGIQAYFFDQKKPHWLKATYGEQLVAYDEEKPKTYTHFKITSIPFFVADKPHPSLLNRNNNQAYWLYYDGTYLSFGHGTGPAADGNNVGFTWQLMEPLKAKVTGFAIGCYNSDNTMTQPQFQTPTAAHTTGVTKKVINLHIIKAAEELAARRENEVKAVNKLIADATKSSDIYPRLTTLKASLATTTGDERTHKEKLIKSLQTKYDQLITQAEVQRRKNETTAVADMLAKAKTSADLETRLNQLKTTVKTATGDEKKHQEALIAQLQPKYSELVAAEKIAEEKTSRTAAAKKHNEEAIANTDGEQALIALRMHKGALPVGEGEMKTFYDELRTTYDGYIAARQKAADEATAQRRKDEKAAVTTLIANATSSTALAGRLSKLELLVTQTKDEEQKHQKALLTTVRDAHDALVREEEEEAEEALRKKQEDEAAAAAAREAEQIANAKAAEEAAAAEIARQQEEAAAQEALRKQQEEARLRKEAAAIAAQAEEKDERTAAAAQHRTAAFANQNAEEALTTLRSHKEALPVGEGEMKAFYDNLRATYDEHIAARQEAADEATKFRRDQEIIATSTLINSAKASSELTARLAELKESMATVKDEEKAHQERLFNDLQKRHDQLAALEKADAEKEAQEKEAERLRTEAATMASTRRTQENLDTDALLSASDTTSDMVRTQIVEVAARLTATQDTSEKDHLTGLKAKLEAALPTIKAREEKAAADKREETERTRALEKKSITELISNESTTLTQLKTTQERINDEVAAANAAGDAALALHKQTLSGLLATALYEKEAAAQMTAAQQKEAAARNAAKPIYDRLMGYINDGGTSAQLITQFNLSAPDQATLDAHPPTEKMIMLAYTTALNNRKKAEALKQAHTAEQLKEQKEREARIAQEEEERQKVADAAAAQRSTQLKELRAWAQNADQTALTAKQAEVSSDSEMRAIIESALAIKQKEAAAAAAEEAVQRATDEAAAQAAAEKAARAAQEAAAAKAEEAKKKAAALQKEKEEAEAAHKEALARAEAAAKKEAEAKIATAKAVAQKTVAAKENAIRELQTQITEYEAARNSRQIVATS